MKLIVSDIEGTLTRGSSWKGLRTYYKANYRPLTYNLFFARWVPRYLMVGLGLISRRRAMFDWMLDEVQLFKGTSAEEFDIMAEWIVENNMWPKRRMDLIAEIEKRRVAGVEVAVVSSAYQPIVNAFARRMNAIPIGSNVEYKGDRLVGLQLPINAYEYKAEAINSQAGEAEILAAYGDTFSDFHMLEMSREPVVVYPDKVLRHAAVERGWRIIEN